MKILLVLISIWIAAEAANILALFPLPLYSHTHTFMPVLKGLTKRGHNVTMVSPFPQKEILTNWSDIVIDLRQFEAILVKAVQHFTNSNRYTIFLHFWKFCADVMETAFQDEALQKLIKDNTLKFDLVITEPLFAQEPLIAFGHKLNVPVVGYFPLSLSPWASYITGNPFLPSYSPNFRTDYSDHMNFLQRLDNTVISFIELMTGIFYYLPMQEKLMEKYMVYPGSENRPQLFDLLKKTSLHLVDSHYSVGYVQSFQPNIVPVGGLSLKGSERLPEDIQNYMDKSINGVIYLSFGSHMPVSSLEAKKVNAILSTFGNLDVNVLLKWENGTIKNKPANVETREWFPQASVLAHPNCRLFITHGGLHGITEAVYYGVPILGIPFFADQEFNMKIAETAGYGFTLKKEDITAEKFRFAVESVLYNKSYKENAVKRSLIIRDRPQPPLETAIYWIEYVLRHKDLSHLKPASADLSLYELYLVDVFLVLVLSILAMCAIVFILIKTVVKLVCSTQTQNKEKND